MAMVGLEASMWVRRATGYESEVRLKLLNIKWLLERITETAFSVALGYSNIYISLEKQG